MLPNEHHMKILRPAIDARRRCQRWSPCSSERRGGRRHSSGWGTEEQGTEGQYLRGLCQRRRCRYPFQIPWAAAMLLRKTTASE